MTGLQKYIAVALVLAVSGVCAGLTYLVVNDILTGELASLAAGYQDAQLHLSNPP